MMQEKLFTYAFNKIGYEVKKSPSFVYDFSLSKDNKKWYVSLKVLKKQRYLHNEHIEKEMKNSLNLKENEKYVLIIDTSKITNEVKTTLKDYPKFIVIDISKVKELLEENRLLVKDVLDRTMRMPEMARLLGIPRNEVYKLLASSDILETVTIVVLSAVIAWVCTMF